MLMEVMVLLIKVSGMKSASISKNKPHYRMTSVFVVCLTSTCRDTEDVHVVETAMEMKCRRTLDKIRSGSLGVGLAPAMCQPGAQEQEVRLRFFIFYLPRTSAFRRSSKIAISSSPLQKLDDQNT
jgi:hypothetical protein